MAEITNRLIQQSLKWTTGKYDNWTNFPIILASPISISVYLLFRQNIVTLLYSLFQKEKLPRSSLPLMVNQLVKG